MRGDRRLWQGIHIVIMALVAMAMLPTAATAAEPQLTRYPYLTDVVGTNATVNWGTDKSSGAGRVTYGEVGAESCTAHTVVGSRTSISVNGVGQYQWKGELTGLDPDTRYCYRVFLGSSGSLLDLLGSDASPEFLTQPPAGVSTQFDFAVLGDWGYKTAAGNPYQAAVIQDLASSGARLALSTGDIAYDGGTQTNYGDLFQSGAAISTVFGPDSWTVAGSSIPMFPVSGNHGRNSTFLTNWPQSAAASSSGGRYAMETYCCLNGTTSKSYPSAWYAFDVGSARFYVLDTSWSDSNVGAADSYKNDYDYHWTPSSDEYQWLESDLATHSAQVKFAFFHYPLYAAQPDEHSDPWLQGEDSLEGLLSRYGVDIAFNGHAHIYERNDPANANGLISYVTGGGGAKAQPVKKCNQIHNVAYAIGWTHRTSTGNACGSASPPTSVDQVYHHLLVSVDGDQVTVTPINSLGQTFDVQTYTFPPDDPVPDEDPPSTPGDLTATAINSGRVDLDWSAASDNVSVTDYRVYRDGVELATLSDESETSYSDTSASPETTYEYTVTALDAAGNESDPSAPASATTPPAGQATPTFVKDRVGSIAAGSGFDVPISTTAGDALVASVAIQAGSTNSVLSVSDSAGNTWQEGPTGFLTGSNTRVEVWYAPAAAAVSNVHVDLAAPDAAAANVAEFTGIASTGALDASAGQGNASSTSAPTPTIATTNADDVLVAAINYPKNTGATLNGADFTPLQDFQVGSVHGHAAYDIVASTGSYAASWTLGSASGTGAATTALKAGP